MTDLRTQELLIVSQMLHLQLALQIGELEWLTIRSENRCERDQERFITSSRKIRIPLGKPRPVVKQNTSGNSQRSAINVQRIYPLRTEVCGSSWIEKATTVRNP